MRIEQSINRSLVLNKKFEFNGNAYLATIEVKSDRVMTVKVEISNQFSMTPHVIEFKVNRRIVRFDDSTLYLPDWVAIRYNINTICKVFYARYGLTVLKSIQSKIKQRLFNKAHQIAREYRNDYKSYSDAFNAALELVYA